MTLKADHIIRFVTVARHLSFTKAAIDLGVDQPWLSQQIRQLETQIGAQLFVRDNKGLQLTRIGQCLLSGATKLSDAAREVEQMALRIRHSQLDCLRFGVPGYAYYLKERIELITQYQRRFPAARFELQGATSPELSKRLRSHELDVAIVAAPFNDQGLEKLFLKRNHASLLIPKECDLAEAESLTLESLRGHRLAVLPRKLAPMMWDAVYEPFLKAGVELVEVVEGHRQALYFHAHQERMCVLTWQWPDDAETPGDDLVHRPFSGWCPWRDSFLVKATAGLNPGIDRFWATATSLFSQNQPRANDLR